MKHPATRDKPIAVGGMGGSGTRLVAEILNGLGFYLGTDLNKANDNLWFTLLFKRIDVLESPKVEFDNLVDIFVNAMLYRKSFSEEQIDLIQRLSCHDRAQHSAVWLSRRAKTLLSATDGKDLSERPWGWKEPNTHVVIDRLIERFQGMKYIHVARNGLDMAYSSNKNQIKLWGKPLFGLPESELTSFHSLKYWCLSHQRVIEFGKRMQSRFFFLNYDKFCTDKKNSIKLLIDFLEVKTSRTKLDKLLEIIRTPTSLGRYKKHGLIDFDSIDIEYVKSLGFETTNT